MSRLLEATKILLFTIFASVIYGWLHDLVTAHVSPAYFLPPHHMIIIETESPLLLALIWGFVATWWMGAFFGFFLATAATLGKNPLSFVQLKKPITFGLIGVLLLAYLILGVNILIHSPITPDSKLSAVLTTHNFSYAASAFLGGGLITWTIYQRKKSGAQMPRQ